MLNIQLWHVRESFEILIEQFSAGTPPGRSQRHLSSGGPVVCIPLPIPSFLTLSPTSPSLASPASRPPPPHAALLSNLLKSSTFFHFSSKLHLISLIAFSCHPHFSTACLGKKKKKQLSYPSSRIFGEIQKMSHLIIYLFQRILSLLAQ